MASNAELSLIVSLKDEATKGLKNLAGVAGGLGKMALFSGAAVATAGIGALGAALASGIGDAREAAKIFAQTESVIAATGGAAGVSAQHVSDYAASLSAASGKSLFGDDQIAESTNLLLTFKEIKGATLDAATAISVDMAQAMGGAPKDAAIQLGKALNDPIAGVGALSRVGVTFSEDQKAMIKTMVETGDVAGAQGVILKELQGEFGGSGEAAAKADGGMAQFKDRMGELAESVGAQVLPALNGLMGWLNSPEVQAGITAVVDALVNGVTTIGTVIASVTAAFQEGGLAGVFDLVLPKLQEFGTNVLAWIGEQAPIWAAQVLTWGQALVDWVAPYIPIVIAKLTELAVSIGTWIVTQAPLWLAQLVAWGQAFVDWISPYIPIVLAKLGEFALAAWGWIQEQAPVLLAQLAVWGAALVDWVTAAIPPLLAKAGELAASLWGWIVEQAPLLLAQLQAWGESMVAWIGPQIPPLLAKAQELASQLLGWIGKQAAPILAKLGEWAESFVAWIVPATVTFLQQWPGFLSKFLDWIGGAAVPLLAKLGDWALQFVAWVVPMIPGFLVAVGGIAAALLVWVGETALVLITKLGEWAAAFLGWIATDVVPYLAGKLGAIISTIGTWITGTAIPWAVGALKSVGSSLVDGIKSGISGAWDTFLGWIQTQLDKIPKAIRDALGINSPARVMIPLGEGIVEGLQLGVEHGLPLLRQQLLAGLAGIIREAHQTVDRYYGGVVSWEKWETPPQGTNYTVPYTPHALPPAGYQDPRPNTSPADPDRDARAAPANDMSAKTVINMDLRGASDPRAIQTAVERAVRAVGLRADLRLRTT